MPATSKGPADSFLSAILGQPADAVTEPLKIAHPLENRGTDAAKRRERSRPQRPLFYRGGDADVTPWHDPDALWIPDPGSKPRSATAGSARSA